MTNEWQPRCDYCGRYCEPADSLQSWGGQGDPPEPYDPENFCEACSEALFNRMLETLLREGIPKFERRPYYVSPWAWYRARGIVRGLRKHGLWPFIQRHEKARHEIRLGHPQVWYCLHCDRPEGHPAHQPDWHRHGVKPCQFRRVRGVWIKPNHMRMWCTCGWHSEWSHPFRLADDALRDHLREVRESEAVTVE